jgi:tRNA pseudouridine13 synthase
MNKNKNAYPFLYIMYTLKSIPDDFIVKEIAHHDIKESGRFAICLLRKRNYNTIRAIDHIAKAFNILNKDFGFAGTKDKNAITEQFISIKNTGKDKINSLDYNDIQLTFKGYSNTPVFLGDLYGNEFIITIRDITKEDIEKIEKKQTEEKIYAPNYYGEQRFSVNNKEIGKHILKSEFKKAIDLILNSNSDYNEKISSLLKTDPNNYIAALRLIPKKLLRLYLNSYQSFLWNKTLTEYMEKTSLSKEEKEKITLPVIGFGTEIEDSLIEQIIDSIMDKENLTFRSFINRKIPELSAEGTKRNAFVELENFKILEKDNEKIKINFKLKKGSYATVAIAYLLDSLKSILNNNI